MLAYKFACCTSCTFDLVAFIKSERYFIKILQSVKKNLKKNPVLLMQKNNIRRDIIIAL